MDGGPFRVPQSSERRSTPSRQEPARRPTQTSKKEREEEEMTPMNRPSSPRAPRAEKTPKRFIAPLVVGVLMLLLGLALGWVGSTQLGSGAMPSVDAAKHQAVFLTNGQVYFGKLAKGNTEYMTLSDVYYLQGQQQAQDVTATSEESGKSSNDIQLVKLGEEIHGPEDQMIVSKDQVLFVENLKPDSTVVRSIQEHKSS